MSTAEEDQPPISDRRYSSDPDTRRAKSARAFVVVGVCVFCLLYGFLFSYFTPFLIMPFVVPVAVLAGLTIWSLPELSAAPQRTLKFLFWAYFVLLVIWPNYLAFAPPGMPWITMIRLTGFPLTATLLICVSVSPAFRTEVAHALNGIPLLWRLVAAFVVLQLASIAFSSQLFDSLDKFIVAQVGWTAVYVTAAFIFLVPRRIERWAAFLWAMSLIVGLLGAIEHHTGRVLWAGHIPKFLQIEDPTVLRSLSGQARAATGIHRVQSTFSSSIALAEYISLSLPFVVQFAFGQYKLAIRLLALVSIPFLVLVVHWTDSRSGVIGCIVTLLLYILFGSILRWKKSAHSIFGPAIALSYPILFLAAIASTFIVGRIRTAVWGSTAQRASTVSRITQYKMGIPKVLSHPWGHGIGQGGHTLHYLTPQGYQTIDTYYLSVALEEGILGFILYYGIIMFAIYVAGRYAYLYAKVEHRDYTFLVPSVISLSTFFIICSVFSEQDCHPLMWMTLGAISALVSRIRDERRFKQETGAAPPASNDAGGDTRRRGEIRTAGARGLARPA